MIGRSINARGPWSVDLDKQGPRDATRSWLKTWRGEIIARIKDVAIPEASRRHGSAGHPEILFERFGAVHKRIAQVVCGAGPTGFGRIDAVIKRRGAKWLVI